jgi:hypothetical protein
MARMDDDAPRRTCEPCAVHNARRLLLVVLSSVLLGCEVSPSPSGPVPSSSPPAASATGAATSASPGAIGSGGIGPAPADGDAVAAATTTIEAVDLGDPATIDPVGGLLFTRSGTEAARAVLESSDDPDALWAALWVYGTGDTDPAPIRRLVGHPDPTIATLAGASLLAFGDGAGFPAMRTALATDGELSGAHPPRTLRDFAVVALGQRIAPTPVAETPTLADDAEPETLADDWGAWLDAHASTLVFEARTGTWSVP